MVDVDHDTFATDCMYGTTITTTEMRNNMSQSRTITASVQQRLVAGSAAGVVAALAYAVELEWDTRVFRHNADDLILLGRLVTNDSRGMRKIGLGVHLINGAVLGGIYGIFVHNRMSGTPAVQGITFGLAETVALYPMAMFEDIHPGVREGRLDRYWHPAAVVQNVFRHVVFGAVLGPLTEMLLRRTLRRGR